MKTIFLSVVFAFVCNIIFSQIGNQMNGGQYLKIIEPNVIHQGVIENENLYNLKHKSEIDRLFFGIKNSFVEFVYMDSSEGSNEAIAFRIIKNLSDNSYELEIMHLPNLIDLYYKRLKHIISEKLTPIFTPFWLSTEIPYETENRIKEHNKQAAALNEKDDLYKLYRPESMSIQINKELTDKIHDKISMLIENFRGVGIPLNITDGFEITFRCIMNDELWT